MTYQYHATPYDISASGFYFTNLEEYRAQAASHRNAFGDPVEEYEIQFIDGDHPELFRVLGINQATLHLWFEHFEDLDAQDAVKAIYLADYVGTPIEDIPAALDDVMLFEGTAQDYAESYIEDTGLLNEIPENLRYYFDIKTFARDMVLGGGIAVIEIDGTPYVVEGG